MRVAVIRALTTSDPALLHAHGRALERAYGFRVVTRCIPDQPRGVHDAASFAEAAPKVVAMARDLEGQVDAVLISCTADPGLSEARGAVRVPVVGAGAAGAAAALALGGTTGVLGVGGSVPEALAGALGPSVTASAEDIADPAGFHTPTGAFGAVAAAVRLRDAGADVILLGSTALSSIGIAAHLRRTLGVPVIDPVLAAGSALASALPSAA